jgi:hypothetical protein
MKPTNQVRSNRKSTSRRSQTQNPASAGRGAGSAPAPGRNPKEKPKTEIVWIPFSTLELTLIDAVCRARGLTREEFIIQAIENVLPRIKSGAVVPPAPGAAATAEQGASPPRAALTADATFGFGDLEEIVSETSAFIQLLVERLVPFMEALPALKNNHEGVGILRLAYRVQERLCAGFDGAWDAYKKERAPIGPAAAA